MTSVYIKLVVDQRIKEHISSAIGKHLKERHNAGILAIANKFSTLGEVPDLRDVVYP